MDSNLFGEPNKGFHTHVMGFAIGDVAMTAVGASVIGKVINKPTANVFIGLIGVGIMVHWYYDIPTALNKKLGLVHDELAI
jgi:hypothetical protein